MCQRLSVCLRFFVGHSPVEVADLTGGQCFQTVAHTRLWGMCRVIVTGDTMFKTTLAAVFSIVLSTGSAQAALIGDPAITFIHNSGAGYSFNAQVRGMRFNTLKAIDVTALGFADASDFAPFSAIPGDAPGLATAQEVREWDCVGNVLASAPIGAGTASAIGLGTINYSSGTNSAVWWYEMLAQAISLQANATYYVAAFHQQNSFDWNLVDGFQGTEVFDPRIGSTALVFAAANSHVFANTPSNFRMNGRSFLIAPATAEVPLPFSIALLGALGLRRRRKAS